MSMTIACECCVVGRARYTGFTIEKERGPHPLHRYHCNDCGEFFYSSKTLTDDEDEAETPELSTAAYLRDLAERLMHVPAMHGTDQYDCDRLSAIAEAIDKQAPTLKDHFAP